MSDERGRGGEASAGIADANEVKPSWHRVKIYITHRPTLNSCCIRSRSTSERKRGCIIHIFTYRPFPRFCRDSNSNDESQRRTLPKKTREG